MTLDQINELRAEELEARAAEISEEMTGAGGADLEALETELNAILARKIALKEERENRAAALEAVKSGEGVKVAENPKENSKMGINEIRASKEYANAYAEYLKKGDDKEVRALLTENATGGTIPVPMVLENRIRNAWENDEIMKRVTKSYIKGVLRIGFEVSASGAVAHAEGSGAIDEETLVLGIASLIPTFIKKTIKISDELYSLRGEEFLVYLYDEFEYQITMAASDTVIDAIIAAGVASKAETPSTTIPFVGTVPTSNAASLIPDLFAADALLSGAARDVALIINRGTYAEIMATIINSNTMTAADVFGRYSAVIFNDRVKDIRTAAAEDTVALVGELRAVQANMPNGDGVKFTFDENTYADEDMIKLTGKLYAGVGVVEPKKLARVVKE